MTPRAKLRIAALLLWIPILFGLNGCVRTRIGVTLDSDGSGTRSNEISWKEGTLDDLGLSEADVRELLDLDPARGWISRREARPDDGGQMQPHLVFARETPIASIADWTRDGADLSVRTAPGAPTRLVDTVAVEVGRGAGYRILEYRETFDARSVKELLDRHLAERIAQAVATARPSLEERKVTELRGLFRAHLHHFPSIVLDDDDSEAALREFVAIAGPQAAWIVADGRPSAEDMDAMRQLLQRAFDDRDESIDRYLEQEVPGVSLLALMNLDFEITVPGRIVETNADRSSDGFAAWERPIWSALQTPIVFQVRTRIEE